MAYNRNQPSPTQLISAGQGTILGNFQIIDSGTTGTGTGFSLNHVTMTDATNGGLHYRVDYFEALASPTITGFVSSAYPKTVAVTTPSSTNVELFYKNAGSDSQITSSALVASSGEGFIPGGLQIRAAQVSLSTNNTTFNFSKPFPTACLSVSVSNTNTGNNISVLNASSFNASSVTIFALSSGGFTPALPVNVSYIAIGY